MVTTVNDIKIIYDLKQVKKINKIKKVINNNYGLFVEFMGASKILSLIPTNTNNAVYMADFDKEFFKMALGVFNNEGFKNMAQNSDVLIALYINFLVKQYGDSSKALIKANPNITDELVCSIFAWRYFCENETFDDFVEYLKYRENSDKIFKWVQKEIRFDVYNYLLGVISNYLKENDFEDLKNISDMVVKVNNSVLNDIINGNNINNIGNLPSMSFNEFDGLFYEFLDYIKAPNNWKQLYNELKNNGRISFEKHIGDIDYSRCYEDNEGNLRILIACDGTINSFVSFVHEFAHYVSAKDRNCPYKLSLSEFPSIFFENIAALFLKDYGYNSDIVSSVISKRKQNNVDTYLKFSSLFDDISKFIDCGSVCKEDKIKYWENNFRIIQEAKINTFNELKELGVSINKVDLELLKPLDVNIVDSVDQECDEYIKALINDGYRLLDGYQYLLDTFLVEKLLNKVEKKPSIISDMIKITENLGLFTLNDILIYFGIENIFRDTRTTDNINIKKLHL